MLAQVRLIRSARRRAVEFRFRTTPRDALAALPLRNPVDGLEASRAQRPGQQPVRHRLGVAS